MASPENGPSRDILGELEQGEGSFINKAFDQLQDRADIELFFQQYVDRLRTQGVPEEDADHQARVNLSHVIGYRSREDVNSLTERWHDFLQGSGPDAEYLEKHSPK